MKSEYFRQTLSAFLLVVLILFCSTGYAENIDDGFEYAWGENVGWLNAEPLGDGGPGVEVQDSELTGYIWAENIGWISLSCENTDYCETVEYGVENDGAGNLSGYAWAENAGWINFAPTGAGVTIDPATGEFSGYAWGENIGWINFAPNGVAVKTSWRGDIEGPLTSNVVADPVQIGSSCTVTATIDDSTTGGSTIESAEYSLNGGEDWDPMDGGFISPTEEVTVTFDASMEVGVYDLCVRGKDSFENWGPEECILLAVYDPEGGFVTGGGWIWSEAGWCQLDDVCANAEGKANFGFVSKYKKGATEPTGNTEFNFSAGGLNFHSSSYEWLVVTGGNYAKFKGSGTINGEGDYKFMLWAGDDDPDTFRIRIWEEDEFGNETEIYDNGFN